MSHRMYLSLSLADKDGQYREGVAVELRRFKVHGFTDNGLMIDLYYPDGVAERRTLRGQPYGDLDLGAGPDTRIMGASLVPGWPSVQVVTRDELRALIGVERVLNAAGHFAEVPKT